MGWAPLGLVEIVLLVAQRTASQLLLERCHVRGTASQLLLERSYVRGCVAAKVVFPLSRLEVLLTLPQTPAAHRFGYKPIPLLL